MVPLVGLQCVIVIHLGHTLLLFTVYDLCVSECCIMLQIKMISLH